MSLMDQPSSLTRVVISTGRVPSYSPTLPVTMATPIQFNDIMIETQSMPCRSFGDFEILPNEILSLIAKACDHTTLLNLAMASSTFRAVCFRHLFRSIQFIGTQQRSNDNLAIFLNKRKSSWANYHLIKTASFVFNEFIYSDVKTSTKIKIVRNDVPLQVLGALRLLKILDTLTLDSRALTSFQIRLLRDNLPKGPKLRVKHLTLFENHEELTPVLEHCEPLESLHVYTAIQDYPYDLDIGLPAAAKCHPQLKRLCVTIGSDDVHSMSADLVSFIAEHYVNLECLVLNSTKHHDKAGNRLHPSFDACFDEWIAALGKLKHLKQLAFCLSDYRVFSMEQRLRSLQNIQEVQEHDVEAPAGIQGLYEEISHVAVESSSEADQDADAYAAETEILQVLAGMYMRRTKHLYTKLVHHIGDLLPDLEEICVFRQHPDLCRGTRGKGSKRLDVRCDMDKFGAREFPAGDAYAFRLDPPRIKTTYQGSYAPLYRGSKFNFRLDVEEFS